MPPTEPSIDNAVRLPRAPLERVVAFLQQATRRLAETPGIETQRLAVEGEAVLLDLVGEWARADYRLALWGPAGRPSLPSVPKSNKPPEIPTEVRT